MAQKIRLFNDLMKVLNKDDPAELKILNDDYSFNDPHGVIDNIADVTNVFTDDVLRLFGKNI